MAAASVTTLDALVQAPTPEEFRSSMLSILETLGFPVTSWEADGVAYQILTVVSESLSTNAQVQQGIAASGFLDLAASQKSADGTDATGWLDLLATYLYATPRIDATFASGDYTITSTNAFPVVLAAGDIRAVNGDGYTYTSATGGMVPANGALTITITADQPGTIGTASAGTITIQDGPSGLSGANDAAIVGLGAESNTALAARCRAKLASLSPNGSAGAYAYFSPLATTTGGVSLGVTRIGLRAGHYDPNETPTAPYPGELYLFAATASGGLGGSVSPPASSGACFELWTYLMGQCVPDAVKLYVWPAEEKTITVTATVYVTQAGITSDQVLGAIASYLGRVPVGGVVIGGQGLLPFSALIDTIHNVSPTVKSVNLTLPSANVPLDSNEIPILDELGSTIVIEVIR